MNVDDIRTHLDRFDFDIRQHQDVRWIDQKCTPDVVSIIADCVLNFAETTGAASFTVKDIWESGYFTQNVMELFSKPHPDNPKASSEYDKFIQQPLRMLAYARVLDVRKIATTNHYSIVNQGILEFVAIKDRNAFKFLFEYIQKVLADSGLLKHFDAFRGAYRDNRGPKAAFYQLKTLYEDFILANTPINQRVEIRRIFSKVLNPYAVANQIPGTRQGRLAPFTTSFSDLLYNQVNWRDLGKDKHLTRQEYEEIVGADGNAAVTSYYIQKAKKLISRKYAHSEVHDELWDGQATMVHHIFPQSDYPWLAAFLENLIKLTPQQHYTKAHPNNYTDIVDKDYQLVCLLSKSSSIETSLALGEALYSKTDFVYVINQGVYHDLVEDNLTFDAIRGRLAHFYNEN